MPPLHKFTGLEMQPHAVLGIGEGTLGNWVRQERVDRGERAGLSTSERSELAELRKENARLRMERDLLKRATAFWVKESGQ